MPRTAKTPKQAALQKTYEQLHSHFLRLLQDDKYKEIRNKLYILFRVLKDNPNKYRNPVIKEYSNGQIESVEFKDQSYYVQSIQDEFEAILFEKIAPCFGIQDCTSAEQLLRHLKTMKLVDQKRAISNLAGLEELMSDELFEELYGDFLTIVKQYSPKLKGTEVIGGTPPPPPSSPPNAPRPRTRKPRSRQM